MIHRKTSVIDAGSCEECGAGGRTITDAETTRHKMVISTIDCSQYMLKLSDSCLNFLGEPLLLGSATTRLIHDKIGDSELSLQA